MPDRLPELFLAGCWDWLERIPCVVITGTHYASDWGRKLSFSLAGRLAQKGWGTINGLALGIDTAAHEGALAQGGRTGATLPSGFQKIYPPENTELAERMVAAGGFLMSEYAPATEAAPDHFRARDRLQSALAVAVVVIETEADGGTMHTARFAVQQQRPLFVFTAPLGKASMTEGNQILAQWPESRLVSTVEELMEILRKKVLPQNGVLGEAHQ